MLSFRDFFIFITAATICIILVPYMSKLSVRVGGVDIPDDRKVHTRVTPRLGGVAIFCSLLFTIIFFCEINQQLKGLLSGAIIIFLTGLTDDLTNLTPRQKLTGQFVAAGLAVLMGGICVKHLGNPFGLATLDLGPFAIPFTIIGIVGVTNAINLLDGLDGLASGVCSIASVTFAILAYLSGNTLLFSLSIAMLGSLIGFLRYNNYPAQIFMGDSGSLVLGYFMGCFSVMLASGGEVAVSPYIPLLILGVPILDTVTVMVYRKRTGKRLFMPDNAHLHHRLLGMGIGHRLTVLTVFGLSYLLSFISIICQHTSDSILLLLLTLIYLTVFSLLYVLTSKDWAFKLNLSSNKSIRSAKTYRSLVRYSAYLAYAVKLLVIAILMLPLFLSNCDISFFSVIPLVILIVSSGVYLLAPTWKNSIVLIFIYSVGSLIIFIIVNFGRNDIRLGIPLINYSYGIFLLLLICAGTKILLRKRVLKSIGAPFEYLILLIVLSIPLMPDSFNDQYHLMTVAAKCVILFAGFKIVLSKNESSNRYILLTIILTSLGLYFRNIIGL